MGARCRGLVCNSAVLAVALALLALPLLPLLLPLLPLGLGLPWSVVSSAAVVVGAAVVGAAVVRSWCAGAGVGASIFYNPQSNTTSTT